MIGSSMLYSSLPSDGAFTLSHNFLFSPTVSKNEELRVVTLM